MINIANNSIVINLKEKSNQKWNISVENNIGQIFIECDSSNLTSKISIKDNPNHPITDLDLPHVTTLTDQDEFKNPISANDLRNLTTTQNDSKTYDRCHYISTIYTDVSQVDNLKKEYICDNSCDNINDLLNSKSCALNHRKLCCQYCKICNGKGCHLKCYDCHHPHCMALHRNECIYGTLCFKLCCTGNHWRLPCFVRKVTHQEWIYNIFDHLLFDHILSHFSTTVFSQRNELKNLESKGLRLDICEKICEKECKFNHRILRCFFCIKCNGKGCIGKCLECGNLQCTALHKNECVFGTLCSKELCQSSHFRQPCHVKLISMIKY